MLLHLKFKKIIILNIWIPTRIQTETPNRSPHQLLPQHSTVHKDRQDPTDRERLITLVHHSISYIHLPTDSHLPNENPTEHLFIRAPGFFSVGHFIKSKKTLTEPNLIWHNLTELTFFLMANCLTAKNSSTLHHRRHQRYPP